MTGENRSAVIMLGPSLDSRGGMATVVNGYIKAGIRDICDFEYIETTRPGSVAVKALAGISAYARFRKEGVCCFYLNGNDRESHKRVLSYMLENGLIRKTKTGKLYNISFKFDTETYAGKYKGSGFSGKIKLADFVDLETGEFI